MDAIKLVQSISNPIFDVLFQLITMLGEDTFFIIVTAVIYWCIDKDLGYELGFVVLTSAAVNFGVKDYFKIPRPIGEPGIRSLRIQTAEGYSFPSGHTQNTATIWTFFMVRFKRSLMYAAGILVILLVGFSRLYLGVHTLFDVVGGVIIGVVWVFTWKYIFYLSIRHDKKSIVVSAVAAATVGLFVFKDTNYYKTVGALTGLMTGYLIEPCFICFKEKASLAVQLLKAAFGMGVLYVLKLVLKAVLPELLISDYFRYMILMLWVTVAVPIIFKYLKTDRL